MTSENNKATRKSDNTGKKTISISSHDNYRRNTRSEQNCLSKCGDFHPLSVARFCAYTRISRQTLFSQSELCVVRFCVVNIGTSCYQNK